MSVNDWILNRENDVFIIVDDDGNVVYDARSTEYEPQSFICNSLIIDIYVWGELIVLSI